MWVRFLREKVVDLSEAINLVKDGDMITVSGLSMHRTPMEFVREIIRKGIKDLILVDREPGMWFDLLVGAGCVKKVIFAMVGFEVLGLAPNFRRMAEAGKIEVEESACGAIIGGFRAAAMGIPFLPLYGLIGSDLMKIHEKIGDWKIIKSPFDGETLVAVKAIQPDVAIIHAQQADQYGNVRILGPKYEDAIKPRAAKKVIITVEEIIDHEKVLEEPEKTTIPHFYVDAVVKIPKGAYPTSCFKYYDADLEHIKMYLDYSIKGKFQEYLEKYVYGKG